MTGAGVLQLPLPETPYRGLDPYRFCDQAIFLERETEAERLARLITRYRASLLYGESGVGKSSLINAGLIPKALADEISVERLRVQPRPGHEFVVERIARSANEEEFLPSILIRSGEPQRTALSAEELTSRIRDAAGARLLLIFDQFEELLTLTADAAAVDGTIESQNLILNSIVTMIQDRKNTNLRLLFIFREDYLAKFERFFYFCPELPDRFLRLTPPPASALRRVLRGPFESGQIPPGYWKSVIPELALSALEQQLRPAEEGTGINLSKVQIAALQVWRSADPAKVLTGRTVEGLVSDYLQDQLNGFREQRSVAESLLSLMITRQGTRRVITEGEVLDEAGRQDGVSPDQARGGLEKLVTETRLVRRDHHRGATTYEIVSEFLVPWIRPLKLQREARKARNLWLKRAAALVVMIGVILGGIFSWKYKTTTVEARGTALVKQAETAARLAQDEVNEAQARAGRAKSEAAQLNQRLQELQSLLKTQSSDREKKLLEDLSGKEQELTREKVKGRDLTQEAERLRQQLAQSAQALEAEKKGRAAEVAALRKQINEPPSPGPSVPEPVAGAKEDTGPATSAAAVSQVGIVALRHDKDVKSAAFSPDGHRIVTTSSNVAYVWAAETGLAVGKPLMQEKDVRFAAFSSDNKQVVTVSANEARVWDADTGMQFGGQILGRHDIYSAALFGHLVVTASSDGVQEWDPQTPTRPVANPIQRYVGRAPIFSSAGDLIVSFSDKFAQVLKADFSGKPVGPELPRKGLYEPAAFSLDGQRLIVASEKIAQVYEVGTGKPQGQPLNHKDTIHSLALDGAGRVAVTGSWREAQLWDVSTGTPIGASVPRQIGTSANCVALSPDGHRLLVCSGKVARIYVVASN